MKQLFQDLRSGKASLQDVPVAEAGAGELLIRNTHSLVSPGTERMLAEFGKSSWLSRARQQPDKVKQVLQKIRTDGLETAVKAVFSKLEQPLPVGYCSAGVVIKVGSGVNGYKVGDRVISNGRHAEVVCVPEHLCARVPERVDNSQACFTVISAIALQGIRLSSVEVGESVAVIGLGLIGLLSVQLLKASGCRVIGFDLDARRVEMAKSYGAEAFSVAGEVDPVQAALSFSEGYGVDAVLITAATKSAEPIKQAPKMCRKRGKVVLVGVVDLQLSRDDFYAKEISFQVSCSYGPGRYERNYEEKGLDYPIGFVRWTEQRNFLAVLELLREGRLKTAELISQRVAFKEIEKSYDDLLSSGEALGVLIEYPAQVDLSATVKHTRTAEIVMTSSQAVVGFIGAGAFTRSVLLPAFKKSAVVLKGIASRTGVSSADLARKYDFEYSTTDYQQLLQDSDINTVVITTRHDSHADLVIEALEAEKHVFVEKPLALTTEQLERIEAVYSEHSDRVLLVGFNRRFSPHARRIKELTEDRQGPLCMTMTVNAGQVPADSWLHDRAVGGGRIIGEACHFIDLLMYLAGAEITETCGVVVDAPAGQPSEDMTSISLKFADGSIGTVHYFANGHKDLPKERLELFCDGQVLLLDNFRELKGVGFKGFNNMKLWKQDKGHAAEVQAFLDAVSGKGPLPISWEEMRAVSQAVIEL